MDKNRRSEAGTDICRAGRQVAKLIVERIRHFVAQFRIQTLQNPESVRDVKPGMERLQPEVILFVYHDADAARQINGRACPHRLLVEACQLFAYEVPLMEQQPILGGKLVDAQQHAIVDRAQAAERLPYLRQDSQPLAVSRAGRERVALQIPGEANTRRDDNVAGLAGGIQPAGAAVGQKREIQHYSIPLSLSRRPAASPNCSASIASLRRSRSSVAVDTCGRSLGSGAT